MDLTPHLLGDGPLAGSAERWASSGAMALTGHTGGPPLGAPAGVVGVLDAAAASLRTSTAAAGVTVEVDGPALLGERAAFAGLRHGGAVSCGGATRLLRAADGWIAVALPRPADLDLLPAWLGIDPGDDAWAGVKIALSHRPIEPLVESAGELGLAVAALGERRGDADAVIATEWAPAPAATTLRRIRVVDLSSLWAGPLCGQLLGLAGMEVVKVESAQRPDAARNGSAGFFDLLNAAKPSVVLDLEDREGVAALHALIRSADVLIESSRPRALTQLGIDANEIVAAGHVRVWISITAHGRTAPYDVRVGFGDDSAVAGGLVATDGIGPLFCADAIADPATGVVAAAAAADRLLAGGCWLLDIALARTSALMATGETVAWAGEAAPPRARPVVARAAPLGRDTAAVLDGLRAAP